MIFVYLVAPFIVFSLVPSDIASQLKPLEPYFFMMILVISYAIYSSKNRLFDQPRFLVSSSLVLVAALLICTAFSDHLSRSVIYTIRYLIYLSFAFALASIIDRKELLERLIRWVLHIANLTALYAVYQYFNPPEKIPGLKAVLGYTNVRVFSTFVNPNFYAEYLAMVIPLTLVLILDRRKVFWRFYGLFSALLLSGILLLTYTRGSFLALVAGIAYFMLIEYPLLLIPVAILGVVLLLVVPGFAARFIDALNLAQGSEAFRLKIWRAAFESINDARELLVGSGPYTFMQELKETVLFNPRLFFGYYEYSSHNVYILTLVEGGILLLAAWVYYYASLLYTAIKARLNSDRHLRLMSSALSASVIALMVNGLTSSTYYHPQTMTVFFYLAGLLIAVYRLSVNQVSD